MTAMDRTVFGTVRKVHGIKGGVKLGATSEHLALLPQIDLFFVKKENEWLTLTLEGLAGVPHDPIVYFEEIQDRSAAEELRGQQVYVAADQLPALEANEFLIADLIGCQVVDETDTALGTVVKVEQPGQHEVLVVSDGDTERLVPFVEAWILSVDVSARKIQVASEEQL